MFELKIVSKHWEIVVDVGNDWGTPSYTETRIYKNKEEIIEALEQKDYYEIACSIKEVVEYERDYEEG